MTLHRLLKIRQSLEKEIFHFSSFSSRKAGRLKAWRTSGKFSQLLLSTKPVDNRKHTGSTSRNWRLLTTQLLWIRETEKELLKVPWQLWIVFIDQWLTGRNSRNIVSKLTLWWDHQEIWNRTIFPIKLRTFNQSTFATFEQTDIQGSWKIFHLSSKFLLVN